MALRAGAEPGFNRRDAVAGDRRAMAEPGEQRAGKQRVDLVVLGYQDRSPSFAACGGASGRDFRRRGLEREIRRVSRAASEAARTGLTR